MSQIRLADRQGLLTGFHLSIIQFYASSMLVLLDQIDREEDQNLRLKHALLSIPDIDPTSVFPKLNIRDAATVDDDEAPMPEEVDADGNPIAVKYDFSNAEFDPKKAEEEITEMLARYAEGQATFEAPTYTDWV